MNKKQEVKKKQNIYNQQQDYGQFDYGKQYREEKINKDDYEIYQKEDYSQYVQKNSEDQYYYNIEHFDEQNQNEQNNNDNQDDKFEDVPNIKKILTKKQKNENKIVKNETNQASKPKNQKQDYQQYENDEQNSNEQQQEEEGDQDYEYIKGEEQNGQDYEQSEEQDENQNDEEEDGQENNVQQYNQLPSKQKQVSKKEQIIEQQQKDKKILKNQNSKQNNLQSTDDQNNYKAKQNDYYDDEDDQEEETEMPEKSSQQLSSKTESSNNYLKNTKSFQTKASLKQDEKSYSKLSEPFDNIYNTKKYPLGIVDDPELEAERKNLWKAFGRECAAGKELFSLYKCHQPPKMNYPKPKQKTAEELLPKPKEIKPCPQKTSINYPPLSYKEPKQRFYKVDFIPKRKPEAEIKKELEEIQRNPYVPANTGKNRKDLIEKLQQKFKNLRGGLPKCAELPMIDENKMVYDEEMIKTQASKRIGMKNKVFTGQYEDRNDTKTQISDDPVQECNQLFDQIMQEIEERQEYLESIQNLKEPALKLKIKKEIIERVAELQKVTELKQRYM